MPKCILKKCVRFEPFLSNPWNPWFSNHWLKSLHFKFLNFKSLESLESQVFKSVVWIPVLQIPRTHSFQIPGLKISAFQIPRIPGFQIPGILGFQIPCFNPSISTSWISNSWFSNPWISNPLISNSRFSYPCVLIPEKSLSSHIRASSTFGILCLQSIEKSQGQRCTGNCNAWIASFNKNKFNDKS